MINFFKSDKWLSKILKVNAYIINLDNKITKEKIKGFLSKLKLNSFVTAKVSSKDITNISILQELEFKLIDCLVKYQVKTEQILKVNHPYSSQNDFHIEEANSQDALKIAELASKSFSFSRFYLDPKITNDDASQIKYEWVLNYFKGLRGNKLFVSYSKYDKRVVGFILLIEKIYPNDKKIINLDLIAVDSQFLRVGIAYSLIKYAAAHFHSEETIFCVGTQLGNIAANRLYQKLNFQLKSSSYIFHFHKS